MQVDDVMPWERQAGESLKQYQAFVFYRNLPPDERSMDRAYELYSGRTLPAGRRRPPYIVRWAGLNNWTERTAAYDRHRERLRELAEREQLKRDIDDMVRRHTGTAVLMQDVGRRALEVKSKALKPEAGETEITVHQLVRLLTEGTKMERLSRGEPESITEERHGPDAEDVAAGQELMRRLMSDPVLAPHVQRIAIELEEKRGPAGPFGA